MVFKKDITALFLCVPWRAESEGGVVAGAASGDRRRHVIVAPPTAVGRSGQLKPEALIFSFMDDMDVP